MSRPFDARHFVAILALGLLPAACGGSGDPAQTKLVGGHRATEGTYAPVLVWGSQDADLRLSYCTGTKVSERFVLTAAHCVLEQTPFDGARYLGPWNRVAALRPGRKLAYSFEHKVTASTDTAFVAIKAVHLHAHVERCLSSASTVDETCTWRTPLPDVALIEVEPSPGTAFALAPSARLGRQVVDPGDGIVMVGYGAQDDGVTTPPTLKFSEARVADATALAAALRGTDAEVEGSPDWNNAFGTLGRLIDRDFANLGSGDSGGPVMHADGHTIVGVNSDGHCPLTRPTCQRASNSVFARIDDVSGYRVGEWLMSLLAP